MILKRYLQNGSITRGVLLLNNDFVCHTLELPYLQNEQNVSCIPDGYYKLTKYNGTKFKNSFLLHDVPDRKAILIHAGNFLTDTEGCILVGLDTGNRAVLKSREAMNTLNAILPNEHFIRIKTC